jgi:hypothetical protein
MAYRHELQMLALSLLDDSDSPDSVSDRLQ